MKSDSWLNKKVAIGLLSLIYNLCQAKILDFLNIESRMPSQQPIKLSIITLSATLYLCECSSIEKLNKQGC